MASVKKVSVFAGIAHAAPVVVAAAAEVAALVAVTGPVPAPAAPTADPRAEAGPPGKEITIDSESMKIDIYAN